MKPLPVQLAVQGSCVKINLGCYAKLEYQRISSERCFDVIDLLNYGPIQGTPFLSQHRIILGLNSTAVVAGSASSLSLEGKQLDPCNRASPRSWRIIWRPPGMNFVSTLHLPARKRATDRPLHCAQSITGSRWLTWPRSTGGLPSAPMSTLRAGWRRGCEP